MSVVFHLHFVRTPYYESARTNAAILFNGTVEFVRPMVMAQNVVLPRSYCLH